MSTTPEHPGGAGGRPLRMEVGGVLLIVLIVLVASGLYVLVAGSPTKSRQAIDSPNSLPGAPAQMRVNATTPAKPATP
jgi:hypothetical protein